MALTSTSSARGRRPRRLRMVPVVSQVATNWRHEWLRLLALALLCFLPSAAIDAGLEHFHLKAFDKGPAIAVAAGALGILASHTIGEMFFQGVVATHVMARRGGERIGLMQLARSIPYVRLLIADALLVIAVVIASLLLVVPLVLVIGYFWILPTVIKIEHRSVPAAIRRAVELVRGNFWRVFLVFAAVEAIGIAGEEFVTAPVHSFLGDFAGSLLFEALLAPLMALAAVVITLELIDIHGADQAE